MGVHLGPQAEGGGGAHQPPRLAGQGPPEPHREGLSSAGAARGGVDSGDTTVTVAAPALSVGGPGQGPGVRGRGPGARGEGPGAALHGRGAPGPPPSSRTGPSSSPT